ncbi:MAG: enoyl-CoA hydratase/isomerase family protein [Myxococcales bacterium]|nr:enoyl-CoA hydratase/isomerase family protein [Myxococcales bacterium]
MPGLVDYSVSDGVATIALNDPPMNAYTHEMMKDLDGAILEARFDNEVHAIVLTGHGEKFFCAGANIRMLSEVDQTFKYYFCLHANETLMRLEQTPMVVIAAINGHCVGGGLEIALACDIRIARRGAGKMGLPEINLGVLPGTGGTQRLTRLVGKARAMQLMVEGETFPIERAQELGLVHHVYDASSRDDFVSQVVEYAKRLGPPGKAPLAVGRIKRAVQSGADMPLEQGLALERELQAELFASHDAGEGLAAYVGKRTPRFEGR